MNDMLLSPSALLRELKKWLHKNPKAKQLDGSIKSKNNPKLYCLIQIEGYVFRLHLDTKKSAIERFIFKSEELGSPMLALRIDKTKNGKTCLRLNDGNYKSRGWYCYLETRANISLLNENIKAS